MLRLSMFLRAALVYPPHRALGRFVWKTTSGSNGAKIGDQTSGSNGALLPHELPADHQERFIPFDKQVLQHMLLKELCDAQEEDRASLGTLVEQADGILLNHYHTTLERLVALYEPINPDRDTLPTLTLEDPMRLEQEKLLLTNLCAVLEQANFNSLSDEIIEYALSQHDPLFKSQVLVKVADYEYMKFWALGMRVGVPPLEMQMKLKKQSVRVFFQRKLKAPLDRRYCKRVLMAARLKTGHMVLKSYKHIPLETLEHLLPAVRMHISFSDRTFLYFTLLAGGSALFANMTVLGLYSLKVDFALVMLLFAAMMVHRWQRLFQLKRDQHALHHANMLYNKSTSNNGELLVALVRRAQQEHVKEMLLARAFLLLLRQRPGAERNAETAAVLSGEVSDWLRAQTGMPIVFNGYRALSHLQHLEQQLRDG